MTLTVDLQNQGQVDYCLTFFIFGSVWVWPWVLPSVSRSAVKVTRLFLTFLISLISKIVRIDTKIDLLSCLQPEIWKVMQKSVWPRFSRSKHQGQVTDFGFFEILDLENVIIDTSFKSVSCIQPEQIQVIHRRCVTLGSKVNRQGHVIFFHIFDILDLENVWIDIKINFVSCLQPEIRKVMQTGVWPSLSTSFNKDRTLSLSPLDSLTPKTYPWEIFTMKFGRYFENSGGWYPPPLWASEGGSLPWASEG